MFLKWTPWPFEITKTPKLTKYINPNKPTRRQRPKAIGGASECSERGRSALFQNPLFFSGKFLGCYTEAAQNFIKYVHFLPEIGHKKITLLYWF